MNYFHCEKLNKEVTRQNCIGCIHYDDCPQRESNPMMGCVIALICLTAIIFGLFIILKIIGIML